MPNIKILKNIFIQAQETEVGSYLKGQGQPGKQGDSVTRKLKPLRKYNHFLLCYTFLNMHKNYPVRKYTSLYFPKQDICIILEKM